MEVDHNPEDETSEPEQRGDVAQLRQLRSRRRQRNVEGTRRTNSSDSEDSPEVRRRRRRETALQRQHTVERQRSHRQSESDAQITRRRAQDTTAHRTQRSSESDEQATRRRAQDTTAHRTQRSSESDEHTTLRRSQNTAAHRTRRSSESDEQATLRRAQDTAAHRRQRSSESDENAAERRAHNATAHRTRRSSESEVEAAIHRQENAVAHRTARRTTAARRRATHLIAATDAVPPKHDLGLMSETCASCHAKFFRDEAAKKSGTFNVCCNHGKVRLNLFEDYPDLLKELFTGNHPHSQNFLEFTRNFNNSLAVASMDCKLESIRGRGPYHFRVHGHVYHHVGPAVPAEGRQASYGQLYIMDTEQAATERLGNPHNANCDRDLMLQLSRFMSQTHAYARSYKMLYEVYEEETRRAVANVRPAMDIRLYFYVDPSKDRRRYNVPTSNEVAVVYVGPEGDIPEPRMYSVHARIGGLTKVPLISKELDPMLYPLFFLRNDEGWHPDIQKTSGRGRVSQKEYYSFLLSIRNAFNPLHYARRLFQQFVVDSWAKTEQNRLHYLHTHQRELRAERYQVLQDFINDGEEGLAGARIILPATHTNSPRYMTQCYQDAMTIVTRFGKPDFFCTFTCNPKWREIQENLLPGQRAEDRPDLVARVFEMKLAELLKDIKDRHVFGKVIAWIYVVEFQKRGLPHAHMLITVAQEDKPDTVEKIDDLICAEIPDINEPGMDEELLELIATHMIHRQCGPGAPCWDGEKCNKKFPKDFTEETHIVESGYPTYRRRDNGAYVEIGGQRYTNQHVVAYCRWIMRKFGAHCNFEMCGYIDACKYMYKYCYKGPDKATLEMKQERRATHPGVVDEIEEHLDARYVCAPEAMHRIFGYGLQAKSHAVTHLMVHLPDFQSVTFEVEHEEEALRRAGHTTLLGFFRLNRDWNGEGEVDPRTLFYREIPEHFTWVKSEGEWKPQGRRTHNIGRLYSVSPKESERYCLRLLLLNRRGVTSFEDLRTVLGIVHPTAQEAAKALGLIDTADHFERAMDEAVTFGMPTGLRCMFVALMGFEGTSAAAAEWEKHKQSMSEDYMRHRALARLASDANRVQEAQRIAESLAYYDILDMCRLANIAWDRIVEPPTLTRPDALDPVAQEDFQTKGRDMLELLNEEQRTIADAILSGQQKLVFIDGPGGSGKTFVYECIYNILKGRGTMVMCTAWTGIAANLLPDGRTVASLFKLSIEEDCRRSTMTPNSVEGRLLKSIDVFIVDECSMLAYWMLDSINELLKDIHDGHLPKEQRRPFGGRTILLGGDFRQVLPIPSKTSGLTQSQACLKHSPLFGQFHVFKLTQNVRAETASTLWKEYLLNVGNGTAEKNESGDIVFPQEIMSQGDIVEEIFEGTFDQAETLATRAILCPKNKDVDRINSEILQKMNGEERIFLSCDNVGRDSQEDALVLPTEFLNKLDPSGFPPHRLELKEGCVVILLRNLCVKKGLCNGTRMQVVGFGTTNVINCRFINGPRRGETIHIPRIELSSKEGHGFELRRRQFPVKLAFAMTVNKSQGQSLDRVGVDLTEEAFSHGQVYVALSRCKTKEGVKIRTASGENHTKNIVDPSVFN